MFPFALSAFSLISRIFLLASSLQMADSKKVVVIGISGATRSGKTSLASHLFVELGDDNCKWLCQDKHFMRKVIYEQLNGNWEDPRALNHDAYLKKIKQVIEQFKEPNIENESDPPSTKYVILEGFLLFYDKRLVELLDYKFWLEISKQVCHDRRMNTKPVEEDYFANNVWPGYQKYRKRVFDSDELVTDVTEIDGTINIHEIVKTALNKMGIKYEIPAPQTAIVDDERHRRCNCVLL